MRTVNFVRADKEEPTFTDNCFEYKNENYCKTVTTSTTISPGSAQASRVPIQENSTELIRSVDVLLLGVAILFLAIALFVLQKSARLKQKLADLTRVVVANHEEIRELKEQRDQSDFRQWPSKEIESTINGVEVARPQDNSFPYTFDATVYRAPKSDELIETCADMAIVNISDQIFTIADGVSQAFNSARWSELLVQNIITSCDTPSLVELIPKVAQSWDDDCIALLQNEDPQSFTRQKQLQGSQSTLASLRLLNRNHELFWRFHTVGDSLLVIVDTSDVPNLVQRSIPFTKVDDFPVSPDTLSTKAPHLRGHIKTFEILAAENQMLLLMTDALARYAVSHGSSGFDIGSVFPFLGKTDTDFADWLHNARQNGLGDDDSTLIMICRRDE